MSAACTASEPAAGPAARPSQAVSASALRTAVSVLKAIRTRPERSELVRNPTPPHIPHRSYERSTSMLGEFQLQTGTEVPSYLRSCVYVPRSGRKAFLLLAKR